MSIMLEAAREWLTRGAALLPLQPGSKVLVRGFGPNQKRINDDISAGEWFGGRRCNLAVIVPAGMFCIDFDSRNAYADWRRGEGAYAKTLIEKSLNGYHVWAKLPPGGIAHLQTIMKIEFKLPGSFITVAPSIMCGQRYTVLTDYPISEVSIGAISFTPPTKQTPIPEARREFQTNLIAEIKKRFNALEIAQTLTAMHPTSAARYFTGRCPFHKDKGRHFWVDTALNICGCHFAGCRFAGTHDVINLIATRDNLANADAIRALAAEVSR